MKKAKSVIGHIVASVLIPLLLYCPSKASNNLTDPYEIFQKHFEAIGGLDRLKADTTAHVEAELSVFGLKGTVITWSKKPIYQRQEVDLGVFRETSGDNGQYKWTCDVNGKVKVEQDEDVLKRRELAGLGAVYDYLDRHSSAFTLYFKGIDKVNDAECYLIKTLNSMNDDSVITYINTSSFIIEKEISFEAGKETHTLFSDHREVNGVLRAFRQDITELPTGQEMSVRVIKYESDITIDPLLFEPPGGDIRDFRFTDGRSSENVPFEFILDHLFVRVNCGGKERLWILDTGAEITCIDSTFASELGLEQSGDMKVQGTGNTTSLTFVRLPSFSVKGIEFDEQTIACLDMKNLIMDKAGLDAVGVLGYDFLSRFVVKIDYGKRLLSFYEPEAFTYTGGGRTLAAPLKGNSIAVPATVDGVHSGKWCLDIGNGDCTFHFPYAERHRFHQRDGIDVVNTGAGGEYRTREMEFDSFELAGYVIDKPVIGVPVDVRGGTMGETEFIGNLGNSILRHFTLYLDYPNQQVIVEKGDDFDKVFPTSKGGCQIYYNADRQLEVGYVSDNTPAAEAGLRKGDILIAINKIAVEHFNGILAIRDLFLTEAGTKYELAVVRDGRQRNVTLKLRDLYRK